MGEKGEGSGGKGGGNWEWRTPLSTPSQFECQNTILGPIFNVKKCKTKREKKSEYER